MNSASAPSENMSFPTKWKRISETIQKEKIAVLLLQETHLDQNMIEQLQQTYQKNLEIRVSPHPTQPRAKAGVAFVINKKLVKPDEIKTYELIPGRAMILKLRWLSSCTTTILNIYAPNERKKHAEFWAKIVLERRRKHIPIPDFTLGDFNVTEDAIDRSPPKMDDEDAIAALRDVRLEWNIRDSWRHANPTERAFTYRAQTPTGRIQARLDRAYIAKDIEQYTYDWEIRETAIPTDHMMISVKYAPKSAPFVGKGRWTLPTHLVNNNKVLTRIADRGVKLQQEITRIRLERIDRRIMNIQTLWESYKQDIKDIAKEELKVNHHKVNSRITTIENDIKQINNASVISDDTRAHEAFLASQLKQLKKKKMHDNSNLLKAKLSDHGEKPGGIWSAMGKEKRPRNPIHRLKIPNTNPTQYERNTKRMAEIARHHHDTLQNEDIDPNANDIEQAVKMENILNTIPRNQRLPAPQETTLSRKITEDQINKALHLAKDGTATGLDGCPYELWKALRKRHDKMSHRNEPSFNITKTLTHLFRDIQEHGVDTRTEFNMGWMCPLFKKKDPTDIKNYRPITLLNTDYKILTKVLALQLMEHVNQMVHPDQAGFIPKRSIFDHIRLAKTILNYTEMTKEDGAIVALDQEKAYDKIKHDYLWKTMNAFNLPLPFTNTIKALYTNAYTKVAINGVLSDPFLVKRRVRQGDPLSCALFDLAIEPLACIIRNDPNFKGITIPGIERPLKIQLFADDTTLFLNKDDRLDHIQKSLHAWCEVSGARFNEEKTEIIPMGSVNHRRAVAESRKINPNDESPLPEGIRIAQDGEAVRVLGAWIGNAVDDATPWEPILDTIKAKLAIWEKAHPTMNGKRLILQAVVGGRTQFLAKAQGMPESIEKAIVKIISDFTWGENEKPKIAAPNLQNAMEEGGLNMLDIKVRNEAIELMWLKAYLNFTPSRHPWAIVTDYIINETAPPHSVEKARENPFLQSWNTPQRGQRLNGLNNDILRMLQTARSHNVQLSAIRITPQILAQFPAWYHISAEGRPLNNAKAKCLLQKHNVATVADLVRTSARLRHPLQHPNHQPVRECPCDMCEEDKSLGCRNPHECANEAHTRLNLIPPKHNPLQQEIPDSLSLTRSGKRRNETARQRNEDILFDPTLTCKNSLAECFRIFTDPTKHTDLPARRPRDGLIPRCREVTVYTDGACLNNGKTNARCGSSVWFGPNDPRNMAIRVPGDEQSNQIGELAAVIAAVNATPTYQPLKIISDSKYVINGLTTHLESWENDGWIGVKNAPFFKKAAHLLKRRTAKTTFRWTKGHNGTQGNEESDRLAKRGANKTQPDVLDLEIPPEFDIQGAKLATLTQAKAYKGILERRKLDPRTSTTRNLRIIRASLRNLTGENETDRTIWKNVRKSTLRPLIQQFLYRAIHNTYKVGSYWSHIRGSEEREICRTCNETESMDHILTKCEHPTTRTIWALTSNLWPFEKTPWPNPNLGMILGSGCIKLQMNRRRRSANRRKGKALQGPTRLLQILLSESAYLIWVLRCERVIQEKQHSLREVQERWLRAINERLTIDRVTATRIKRADGFTKRVVDTWEQLLEKNGELPLDWLNNSEVLVGRTARLTR